MAGERLVIENEIGSMTGDGEFMSNADSIYRPWIKQYSAANARLLDADVQTLLEAFEKSAALGPAETMIRYFDQALSYEAVDRMSDALAVWLQA